MGVVFKKLMLNEELGDDLSWFEELVYPLDVYAMTLNQTLDIAMAVSDYTSGVAAAEYYLDTDPGAGNGSTQGLYIDQENPMVQEYSVSINNLQPTTTGTHTLGIRVQDQAGNWSSVQTTQIVVVPNVYQRASAEGTIVPGGATSDTGDTLPGINGTTTAAVDFAVYRQANDPNEYAPMGPVTFSYQTGDCEVPGNHCMDFTSMFDDGLSNLYSEVWEMMYSGGDGVMIRGEMNGVIDGVVQEELYQFVLEVTPSTETTPGHYKLRLWKEDENFQGTEETPATYQASGDVTGDVIVQYVPSE